MYWDNEISVSELLGKTLTSIVKSESNDEIIFTDSESVQYKMYHMQDCCEGVYIDDVEGDLEDLIGKPLTQAEEVSNEEFDEEFKNKFSFENEWGSKVDKDGNYEPESYTWTFYKFATVKGYVTIKWLGESNGYYSESVSFVKLD